MTKNNLFIILAILTTSIIFYAFQKDSLSTNSNLTAEQQAQVDLYLKRRLEALKREEYWNCQARALSEAIPLADSIIAEMYAKDLRASDVI